MSQNTEGRLSQKLFRLQVSLKWFFKNVSTKPASFKYYVDESKPIKGGWAEQHTAEVNNIMKRDELWGETFFVQSTEDRGWLNYLHNETSTSMCPPPQLHRKKIILKPHLEIPPLHISLYFAWLINDLMFIWEVPLPPSNTRSLSAKSWILWLKQRLFQLKINVLSESLPSMRINHVIYTLINVYPGLELKFY